MAGEKTEKATPKRKQDERKKGNVFLSKEVVTVVSLLAAFYSFKALSPLFLDTLETLVQKYLTLGATQLEITAKDLRVFFVDGCLAYAKAALPLLLVCTLSNILATMAQTKMLFSAKAFAFKGERLNPLSGLKKMFSMRAVVELIKSLLKISVLLYIVYSVLKDELLMLPRLADMSAMQAMVVTGNLIMKIALQTGLIFLFLAAGDYLYQWWEYEKNLRMSKQEIKDEYKQLEGDPQIKGRQRSLQQQRSRRRMMQNVPKADVVIRNPTHYAIAIQYDQTKHRAPVVIAKGADAVALRIVAIADDAGVYITENKPLARALFDAVELDCEIPAEYYQPIAEVLAFVYSLKKKDMK